MTIRRAVIASLVVFAASVSAADPDALRTGSVGDGAGRSLAARPLLSRADLPRLRQLDRDGVFAALGSFDDRDLPEADFVARALDLLDPQRIAGLAEARQSGDTVRALDAVLRACRGDRSPPGKVQASAATIAAAEDVLEHRFSFYGERHPLPPDIDWDRNPGTAHWGHDLNRFSFLGPLVDAYLATGDERFSRKAVELILDWMAKSDASRCFVGSPYVWGSYLNNAIHCQAWCAQLATLIACEQVAPIELLRVLKSLHDQLAYLEIVTNQHSGNWPTIGMQGMLQCLGTFPVFRDTDRLADYSYLRSTAAHSTIRIDGQDQHSAGRRGTWIAKQPLDLGWRVADGEVRARGVYDLGYGRDNAIAVVHRREIVFVQERCWVVFDLVEGEGERLIESRFQFAPGELHVDGATARTGFEDANLLLIAAPSAAFAEIRVEQGQEQPRRGWYSDSYNKIEPAPALSLSLRTALPWRAATLLFPYRGPARPAVSFTFDGRQATIDAPEPGRATIISCGLTPAGPTRE